jgi:hypothetical protein
MYPDLHHYEFIASFSDQHGKHKIEVDTRSEFRAWEVASKEGLRYAARFVGIRLNGLERIA